MDKSGSVRQLEAVVENLKHDNNIMRDEQMNFETTTEEVAFIFYISQFHHIPHFASFPVLVTNHHDLLLSSVPYRFPPHSGVRSTP